MFKKLLNTKVLKNQKGLTLIEILAVIVILAIIAAIAIPAIGNIINASRDKAVLADISSVVSAAKIAITDGSCSSDTTCTKDDLASYVDVKGFKDTNDKVVFSATSKNNPTITYTLSTTAGKTEEIKTSKIANKLTNTSATGADNVAKADSYASGKTLVLTEDILNGAMGK